jgi:hypothetical protein
VVGFDEGEGRVARGGHGGIMSLVGAGHPLFEGLEEAFGGDGFAEVGVHAGGEAFFAVGGHGAGGEGDDGDAAEGAVELANLAGDIDAGEAGHLDIHEDEVDWLQGYLEQGEALFAVFGEEDAAAGAIEHFAGDEAIDGVVFDEEDVASVEAGYGGGRVGGGGEGFELVGKGELEPEGAAVAGGAVAADFAAHGADEFARDGEAEAGAAVLAAGSGLGLDEGGEDALDLIGGDADAGVVDFEAEGDALGVAGEFMDFEADSALLGELEGVGGEVDEDLAEAVGVADEDGGDGGRDVAVEGDAGGGGGGEDVGDVLEGLGKREWGGDEAEVAGFDLGEIEDVIEEGEEGAGGGGGEGDVLVLVGVEGGGLEDLEEAEDTVHGGAEFMAGVGDEAGFEGVGFASLAEGDFEVGLGLVAAGDIDDESGDDEELEKSDGGAAEDPGAIGEPDGGGLVEECDVRGELGGIEVPAMHFGVIEEGLEAAGGTDGQGGGWGAGEDLEGELRGLDAVFVA